MAKNRKEWGLLHIANMHINGSTVGLFDTLDAKSCTYIVWQTELHAIGCQKENVKKLIDIKADDMKLPEDERKLTKFKCIIGFDDVDKGIIKSAEKVGLKIYTFKEV